MQSTLGIGALLSMIAMPLFALPPSQLSGCSTDPDETPPPSCESALDLQRELDGAVAKNAGYGGGIYQIDGPCGVRFLGVSGQIAKGSSTAMATSDTFEVASITKTFTATLILQLIEEGHFQLETPIGTLLPAELISRLLVLTGHDYSGEITVHQLLNHTSGLADFWTDPPFETPGVNAFLADFLADPSHFWPPEEVLSYVPNLYAYGRPGSGYHYSDTNYVLLGLLIEQITGQELHDVIRNRLLAPLGMSDTYLSYREAPTSSLIESHRYEDDWDMYGKTHQSADWASGGLVSSTRDLSRFMHALAEGEIFSSPSTLSAMRTAVPTGMTDVTYGLGIFRIVLDDGGELWGHDGHGNAFMYYSEGDGHVHVGTLNQTGNDWWPMVFSGVTAVRHP